jgi:hypothetical protein
MMTRRSEEARLVAGATSGEWSKTRKGTAKIYTHPDAVDGRAVVENHWGISFNGKMYATVSAAMKAALSGESA